MIALDLTGQPYTCQSLLTQSGLLGLRHARRFAADEHDPAGGAAGVAAAGVQDVHARVLLDGIDESLAGFNVYAAKALDSQCWHVGMVTYAKLPTPILQLPNE